MICLNTMTGEKTESLKARIVLEFDFVVGGKDHADRLDSISEWFNDDFETRADRSFLEEVY